MLYHLKTLNYNHLLLIISTFKMTISYKVTEGVISLVISHSTTKGEIIFHFRSVPDKRPDQTKLHQCSHDQRHWQT